MVSLLVDQMLEYMHVSGSKSTIRLGPQLIILRLVQICHCQGFERHGKLPA